MSELERLLRLLFWFLKACPDCTSQSAFPVIRKDLTGYYLLCPRHAQKYVNPMRKIKLPANIDRSLLTLEEFVENIQLPKKL